MYRFSYPLKREYPYKWLTPLVAAVLLVAVVIVLFVNILTQSYELVTTTTNDTSVLEDEYRPNRLLNLLGRNTDVSCENALLSINNDIFTIFDYHYNRRFRPLPKGIFANNDLVSQQRQPTQNYNYNHHRGGYNNNNRGGYNSNNNNNCPSALP
ncbi:hypothetical protein F4808DRAFT_464647 [Astrocystis sublimbata]|nr:hypothetical protein F4808DRAFT_464647 [Astrocystis sublimbata]